MHTGLIFIVVVAVVVKIMTAHRSLDLKINEAIQACQCITADTLYIKTKKTYLAITR